MEFGAEEGLVGGVIKGEDVVHPFEPGQHPKVGKQRSVQIGRHTWLPTVGNEQLETIKGGKVSLADRWIL